MAKTKSPAGQTEIKSKKPKLESEAYLDSSRTVEVIGASFCGGQPKKGVDLGPNRMIDNGLVSQLESLNWNVICPETFPSYDHLKPEKEEIYKSVKNIKFVSEVTKVVHHHVKSCLLNKHFALTLGGDHSLGIGTGT